MNLSVKLTLLSASLLLLTGCPIMDRDLDLRYPEPDIIAATKVDDNLCVAIPVPADFQIRMVMIYPRNMPAKERWYQLKPALNVSDGQVCIPSSLYKFDSRREYVVQLIMWSDEKAKRTKYGSRVVISAFEIDNDHAWRVILEEREL